MTGDAKSSPQTLLFSATLPDWVQETARKYMKEDVKSIDLVGKERVRTSTTVQVSVVLLWPLVHCDVG